MAIGAHLGAKMGQDGAKLANLAPRCAQDGQLGGQDGQLGALLGATWRLFLALRGDLVKTRENRKNDDSTSLLKVFGGHGRRQPVCWLPEKGPPLAPFFNHLSSEIRDWITDLVSGPWVIDDH